MTVTSKKIREEQNELGISFCDINSCAKDRPGSHRVRTASWEIAHGPKKKLSKLISKNHQGSSVD